ncbi:hypothetical protein Bbelb_250270 [Branchiostoma belcheri]|nr:hypothetical protein Bbelb_250270 [Branchiostoma belcheri]
MVVSSNKDSPTVLPCLYLIKRAWNRPNSSNSCGVRLQYYIDRESSNGKNTHSCINTGMPADGELSQDVVLLRGPLETTLFSRTVPIQFTCICMLGLGSDTVLGISAYYQERFAPGLPLLSWTTRRGRNAHGIRRANIANTKFVN